MERLKVLLGNVMSKEACGDCLEKRNDSGRRRWWWASNNRRHQNGEGLQLGPASFIRTMWRDSSRFQYDPWSHGYSWGHVRDTKPAGVMEEEAGWYQKLRLRENDPRHSHFFSPLKWWAAMDGSSGSMGNLGVSVTLPTWLLLFGISEFNYICLKVNLWLEEVSERSGIFQETWLHWPQGSYAR